MYVYMHINIHVYVWTKRQYTFNATTSNSIYMYIHIYIYKYIYRYINTESTMALDHNTRVTYNYNTQCIWSFSPGSFSSSLSVAVQLFHLVSTASLRIPPTLNFPRRLSVAFAFHSLRPSTFDIPLDTFGWSTHRPEPYRTRCRGQ